MTALEVLKKARGLIETRWVKGALMRRPGYLQHRDENNPQEYGYCAIGAIGKAQGMDWEDPRYDLARWNLDMNDLLALMGFASVNGLANADKIASWNDDPNRTKEEVLAAFDAAIVSAELCADAKVDYPDGQGETGRNALFSALVGKKAKQLQQHTPMFATVKMPT